MNFITVAEAARIIASGSSVLVSGSGGGHGVPEAVLEAIEARFLSEAAPRDLTLIHVVGIGDRQQKGAARFGHEGMLKRSITSALIDSPILMEMALANKFESYILPQGVMSQLMRDMTADGRDLSPKPGFIRSSIRDTAAVARTNPPRTNWSRS